MEVKELIIKHKIVKDIYTDDEHIIFEMDDGKAMIFHHNQDCCEDVGVEQIDGDLSNLIGEPLLMAEETIDSSSDDWDSVTWTFYKFATIKGYVTIRWAGYSNGYYSESVDMALVDGYASLNPHDVLDAIDCDTIMYDDVYIDNDDEI